MNGVGVRCVVDIFKLTASAQSIYREVYDSAHNAFKCVFFAIVTLIVRALYLTNYMCVVQKAESRAQAGVQDASERSERLEEERRALLQQATDAEVALAEARQTSQRHLLNKRDLKTALSDSQKRLAQAQDEKKHALELLQQHKEQFNKQVKYPGTIKLVKFRRIYIS